jgi:hypothetical protein
LKKSPAALSVAFNNRLSVASILNDTGVVGVIANVHEYRLRAPFRAQRIHTRLSAIGLSDPFQSPRCNRALIAKSPVSD